MSSTRDPSSRGELRSSVLLPVASRASRYQAAASSTPAGVMKAPETGSAAAPRWPRPGRPGSLPAGRQGSRPSRSGSSGSWWRAVRPVRSSLGSRHPGPPSARGPVSQRSSDGPSHRARSAPASRTGPRGQIHRTHPGRSRERARGLDQEWTVGRRGGIAWRHRNRRSSPGGGGPTRAFDPGRKRTPAAPATRVLGSGPGCPGPGWQVGGRHPGRSPPMFVPCPPDRRNGVSLRLRGRLGDHGEDPRITSAENAAAAPRRRSSRRRRRSGWSNRLAITRLRRATTAFGCGISKEFPRHG